MFIRLVAKATSYPLRSWGLRVTDGTKNISAKRLDINAAVLSACLTLCRKLWQQQPAMCL